jgi:hypothetical protein
MPIFAILIAKQCQCYGRRIVNSSSIAPRYGRQHAQLRYIERLAAACNRGSIGSNSAHPRKMADKLCILGMPPDTQCGTYLHAAELAGQWHHALPCPRALEKAEAARCQRRHACIWRRVCRRRRRVEAGAVQDGDREMPCHLVCAYMVQLQGLARGRRDDSGLAAHVHVTQSQRQGRDTLRSQTTAQDLNWVCL